MAWYLVKHKETVTFLHSNRTNLFNFSSDRNFLLQFGDFT